MLEAQGRILDEIDALIKRASEQLACLMVMLSAAYKMSEPGMKMFSFLYFHLPHDLLI